MQTRPSACFPRMLPSIQHLMVNFLVDFWSMFAMAESTTRIGIILCRSEYHIESRAPIVPESSVLYSVHGEKNSRTRELGACSSSELSTLEQEPRQELRQEPHQEPHVGWTYSGKYVILLFMQPATRVRYLHATVQAFPCL